MVLDLRSLEHHINHPVVPVITPFCDTRTPQYLILFGIRARFLTHHKPHANITVSGVHTYIHTYWLLRSRSRGRSHSACHLCQRRHGTDPMSDRTLGAWKVCSLDGVRAWKLLEPTKWAVVVKVEYHKPLDKPLSPFPPVETKTKLLRNR